VNLRNFDLNLLRIFEAIFQDRSVSKAADRLALSQPAVSNALNRMRRQFADPLFVRTQVGMEPTPKAQQLALAVQQGLTTIRAGLISGFDFDPAESRRCFTLLMTDVGELAFLPAVLPKLIKQAPYVDVSVIEFGLERYEELLNSGMADLAIGRIKLPDALLAETIHTSPFVVLMGRDNRRLQLQPDGTPSIAFEDYLEAPHVFVMPRGASGDPVTEALGDMARLRRIAISIPHATVLPAILVDTDLIATVPKVCADQLTASGNLCTAQAPFPIQPSIVQQWWHRRNTTDPGHQWLRLLFASTGV
jgi:DNA-binding transcriptional LysR family regulator